MENKNHFPFNEIDSIRSIVNKISIFGGLSEEQLFSIFKLAEVVKYGVDERVFSEGDEPSYIYIIKDGEIKLVSDIDREPLEIAVFNTGDCFGEVAVIGIQPHSATAVVSKAAELVILKPEDLLSFYETDKELFSKLILNIAREACRRIHRADQVLLHYVQTRKH